MAFGDEDLGRPLARRRIAQQGLRDCLPGCCDAGMNVARPDEHRRRGQQRVDLNRAFDGHQILLADPGGHEEVTFVGLEAICVLVDRDQRLQARIAFLRQGPGPETRDLFGEQVTERSRHLGAQVEVLARFTGDPAEDVLRVPDESGVIGSGSGCRCPLGVVPVGVGQHDSHRRSVLDGSADSMAVRPQRQLRNAVAPGPRPPDRDGLPQLGAGFERRGWSLFRTSPSFGVRRASTWSSSGNAWWEGRFDVANPQCPFAGVDRVPAIPQSATGSLDQVTAFEIRAPRRRHVATVASEVKEHVLEMGQLGGVLGLREVHDHVEGT